LRTLLTGLDNDAHGRIARWQERLGEYDIQLLHRLAKTHFMGIADGLSHLPTRLMGVAIVEDREGLTPRILSVVAVTGLATDVMVNSFSAQTLRSDRRFWGNGHLDEIDEERVNTTRIWQPKVFTLGLGDMTRGQEGVIGEIESDQMLVQAANDLKRRRWETWLRSGMYGMIVQARLDEWEGVIGSGRMRLGRSERKS